MKYDIENKKIIDMLDELGEEYKDLLVEKALSQHQEYDVDQINLSTLIRLDEKAKEYLLVNEQNNKRNRRLSFFSIIGLIYTLLGLMLLVYDQSEKSYGFDLMTRMSFLIIMIGLFILLFSLLMKSIPYSSRYQSKDTSNYFNYKIINIWKQIEGLLVQLTPVEENLSLNRMISNLMDLKLLSENDALTINKILNLRNQVVNSNNIEKSYTTNEIQKLLRDSNNIIKKLEKFENS